jgi:PPM family protein phosphatase
VSPEGIPGRRVHVTAWGHTDTGRIRSENQDTFLVAELAPGEDGKRFLLGPGSHPPGNSSDPVFTLGPRGALLLVADGMGGPAGGGRASRLALAAVTGLIEREWLSERAATPQGFTEILRRAVATANQRVRAEAKEDPALFGMGTTLTMAGLLDGGAYLVQVGDSRGYLLRDGQLFQLTRDQSMVQELLDAGAITEVEARTSPQRNVILQALGTAPELDPVLGYQELRGGTSSSSAPMACPASSRPRPSHAS